MEKELSEAMVQAVADIKEQMGPLVEIAEYMLEGMANSKIPANIATFIENLRLSLTEKGFTREEAVAIIISLDIASMLKQEKNK
jgi:pyrroline-5-carboxylate reductase